MKVDKYLFCAALFLFFFKTNAQTLRGTVRDADSGAPLTGATAILLKMQTGADTLSLATNPSGAFQFEGLKPGYYRLLTTANGYESQLIGEINIAAGKAQLLEIALSRSATTLPRVTISSSVPGRRPLQPLSEIPLTRDQTLRFPAMYFDPARLAAAFAGVAQTDDGINGMSIRGNNPGGVRWRLEGVEVVNPNHLPNAGTFDDRPASASGGVLMFSAQLLDNSSLLTGSFPAGFGDALGGVMDMNMRQGNPQKHEFTAQAGLIGLDVSAGGPLTKNGKNAYIVNYRYATLGLLGNMGITFGGEKIGFQDLSFKTNFTGKKGGTWSLFGVFGLSSNVFKPEGDTVKVYKDLFNIDFSSKTAILGFSYRTALGTKTWLKTSFAASGQQNERTATSAELNTLDKNTENHTSLSAILFHKINEQNRLSGGLNGQIVYYSGLSTNNLELRYDGNVQIAQVQPWINWDWHSSNRAWQLKLGLHANEYRTLEKNAQGDGCLEPRAALTYQLARTQSLTIAYGLHSQFNPLWLEADTRGDVTSYKDAYPNRGLGFMRAHHIGIRHSWNISDVLSVKTELYYQRQFDIPVSNQQGSFSIINETQLQRYSPLSNTGIAENKGLEISIDRVINNNWYMALNTSLFTARYQGSDAVWRNARWDLGHLANATVGKEWYRERSEDKVKAFGINGRLVWTGGYRAMEIDAVASEAAKTTVFDTDGGFQVRQSDYFRFDLRVYWKRSLGARRNSTFAMDFQNVTGQKNMAYRFYDPFTKKIETKYQLEFVPNLSWRLEF
jgi:hypothetical protein